MMENRDMDLGAQRAALLGAMLPHVPFDGWSETALKAAADEAGVSREMVKVLCPRGPVDMAVAYHRAGDRAMRDRLTATDLSAMRFREKVAAAVRFRIEAADREVVRRGAALFALPQHGPTGARLVWDTADAIWTALGDTSQDFNWYTKRATLSGVYASTVLYWLGDAGANRTATWDFLDRRIEDVMRFEKLKAQVRDNPVLSKIMEGPKAAMERMRAPGELGERLAGLFRRQG
jgi:ubiquinone biosynthesis protein COQ9